MKHTPGPWKIGTEGYRVYGGSYGVAAIEGTSGAASKEAEANARLIASAPELLAACEMALEHLKVLTVGYTPTRERLERVIAKAKGEA